MITRTETVLELIAQAEENKSETDRIEFRDMRGGFSGNSCWKSISSFSHNPEGGYIIFGVAEDSSGAISFVGVGDQAARIKEGMVSYCRDDMVSCLDPVFLDFE
jgi:predicted HTH transcriptional regulator